MGNDFNPLLKIPTGSSVIGEQPSPSVLEQVTMSCKKRVTLKTFRQRKYMLSLISMLSLFLPYVEFEVRVLK